MASSSTALTLPAPLPSTTMATSLPQKLPAPVPYLPAGLHPGVPGIHRPLPHPALGLPGSHAASAAAAAMDFQRAQIMDLRFRYSLALQHTASGLGGAPGLPGIPPGTAALHPGMHDHSVMAAYLYSKNIDPRARFFQEEPKPSQSYIGLISMALLSSKESKLILGDIYQWILDNYPYFRNRGPGWRNSIRHNLSLNDCFIKAGRAANGKGHYWAIHPANMDDFKRGDFRRRRAQRKVRKAMGLDVPDEEDSPSPPPGPEGCMSWRDRMLQDPAHRPRFPQSLPESAPQSPSNEGSKVKRGFDMASLLAPEKTPSSGCVPHGVSGLDDSGVQCHSPSDHHDLHSGSPVTAGKTDEDRSLQDEDDVYIDVEEEDDKLGGVKRKLDLDDVELEAESSANLSKLQKTGDSLDVSSSSSSDLNHSRTVADDKDQLVRSAISKAGVSMWPRPMVPGGPPIWTPGQPSAFYPSPFLAWGGLHGLSLPPMYAAGAGGRSPPEEERPDVQAQDCYQDKEREDRGCEGEDGKDTTSSPIDTTSQRDYDSHCDNSR